MINFFSVMPCLTKEKAVSVKKNDLSENGETTDTLNGVGNINETENPLINISVVKLYALKKGES